MRNAGFCLLVYLFLVDAVFGFDSCRLVLRSADDNRRIVQIEVADSAEERAIGLMGRGSVPSGTGMLFDFGGDRAVAMWMKNTLISLDMAFFTANGALAHVARRTEPLSLAQIPAPVPVRYVLELKAGEGDFLVPGHGQRLDLESLAACSGQSQERPGIGAR